jgi:hypothetical protein
MGMKCKVTPEPPITAGFLDYGKSLKNFLFEKNKYGLIYVNFVGLFNFEN